MANLPSIPDTKNMVLTWSKGLNDTPGIATVKLVPKDLDGNILDLTGYNAATLYLTIPTQTAPQNESNHAITVGTADATGIEVSLTRSQGQTFANEMTQPTGKMMISVSDGTDDLIANVGTLALSTTA